MSIEQLKSTARSAVTRAFFYAGEYVHTDASEHDCKLKLKRDQQVVTPDGSYMLGDVIDVTLTMAVQPKMGGAFIVSGSTYEVHQTLSNNGSRGSYLVKKL